MDLNDFWQEHKGFLLSVAIGLVAFIVGFVVLQGQFNTKKLRSQLNSANKNISRSGKYGSKALKIYREEGRKLSARQKLGRELVVFNVRPAFNVAKDPYPERRYASQTAIIKEQIFDRCNGEDVEVVPRKGADRLGLPVKSPLDKGAIQRTLIGLDLAERTVSCLLDASNDALQSDRRALGLESLDQMSIDIGATKRGSRNRQSDELTLDQVTIRVRFHCGSRTLKSFLEKSQERKNPVQISRLAAQFPRKGKDNSLVVDMTMAAPLEKGEE